ncbi:hypothetical protein [Mesorhizobium sp. M1252]|uniref:hypothetical protein n=1 Tax=Mesorhizobium sp. M1252 TaxID=2957073 RepID=UPI00333AF1F8
MFSRLAKTLLITSAIAPIGLVYAWVAYREGSGGVALLLLLACAALVQGCLVVFRRAPQVLERFPFQPQSVEAADRENVAFLLLYLSPLFTSQFGQLNLSLLIPTICIFTLLTATGYNYHFNPLLGLIGWHFYKVTSAEGVTYVIITKKQLRNTNQIGQVGQLTEYILIDLGEDNAG